MGHREIEPGGHEDHPASLAHAKLCPAQNYLQGGRADSPGAGAGAGVGAGPDSRPSPLACLPLGPLPFLSDPGELSQLWDHKCPQVAPCLPGCLVPSPCPLLALQQGHSQARSLLLTPWRSVTSQAVPHLEQGHKRPEARGRELLPLGSRRGVPWPSHPRPKPTSWAALSPEEVSSVNRALGRLVAGRT